MNHNEITQLLLKLSGLLIIIFTIISIPNYFTAYSATQLFYGNSVSDIPAFLLSVIVPFFISLLIGLFLFAFPTTIAKKILRNASTPTDTPINEITIVAYSAIGMYFLAISIADLVYWGSYFTLMANNAQESAYFTTDNTARVLTTFAEMAIGLVLLLGSRGINRLISRFRNAGTK